MYSLPGLVDGSKEPHPPEPRETPCSVFDCISVHSRLRRSSEIPWGCMFEHPIGWGLTRWLHTFHLWFNTWRLGWNDCNISTLIETCSTRLNLAGSCIGVFEASWRACSRFLCLVGSTTTSLPSIVPLLRITFVSRRVSTPSIPGMP